MLAYFMLQDKKGNGKSSMIFRTLETNTFLIAEKKSFEDHNARSLNQHHDQCRAFGIISGFFL
jgi:hypothetical protein